MCDLGLNKKTEVIIIKKNNITIIKEEIILGQDFKIYGNLEDPLFLVKDVARWLGYDISKSARLLDGIDETEKVRHNASTLGGVQDTCYGVKLFTKTLVLGKGQLNVVELVRKEYSVI